MALIVITVQDGPGGAVVSLAAEPELDMSAAPTTQAQTLVHLMLAALPMNQPANDDTPLAEGDPDVDPDPVDHIGPPLVAGPHGPVG